MNKHWKAEELDVDKSQWKVFFSVQKITVRGIMFPEMAFFGTAKQNYPQI